MVMGALLERGMGVNRKNGGGEGETSDRGWIGALAWMLCVERHSLSLTHTHTHARKRKHTQILMDSDANGKEILQKDTSANSAPNPLKILTQEINKERKETSKLLGAFRVFCVMLSFYSAGLKGLFSPSPKEEADRGLSCLAANIMGAGSAECN